MQTLKAASNTDVSDTSENIKQVQEAANRYCQALKTLAAKNDQYKKAKQELEIALINNESVRNDYYEVFKTVAERRKPQIGQAVEALKNGNDLPVQLCKKETDTIHEIGVNLLIEVPCIRCKCCRIESNRYWCQFRMAKP
jgi:chromosome segregation ATPase